MNSSLTFLCETTGLRESQMMRMAGHFPANQTRPRSYEGCKCALLRNFRSLAMASTLLSMLAPWPTSDCRVGPPSPICFGVSSLSGVTSAVCPSCWSGPPGHERPPKLPASFALPCEESLPPH